MACTPESAASDQAAGLRRLMAAPLATLCTVLSADGREHKSARVARLAASMVRRGHAVIVVDARVPAAHGAGPTLRDVALGRVAMAAAGAEADRITRLPLGLPVELAAGRPCSGAKAPADAEPEAEADRQAIADLLRSLAEAGTRVLVDAELDSLGRLPLPLLADGDLVVQLSGSASAVRDAYQMLRAVKALCGRGTVSLLVTDADAERARHVHANLFHAASRYLGLPVRSITAPPPARAATFPGPRHV